MRSVLVLALFTLGPAFATGARADEGPSSSAPAPSVLAPLQAPPPAQAGPRAPSETPEQPNSPATPATPDTLSLSTTDQVASPEPPPVQRGPLQAPTSRAGAEHESPRPAVPWSQRRTSGGPWQLAIAYRGSIVHDAGYGPFSTNDWLGQVTLAGSRVLVSRGRVSLVGGLAWDYGLASATARGADTSLTLDRLTVPITMRVAPGPTSYLFATIAPGATYEGARIEDPQGAVPALVTNGWVASADASVGAAQRLVRTPPLDWWVSVELGYSITAPFTLALAPEDAGTSPPRAAPTDLGTLSMNGPFGRLAVAVAF